MEKLRYSIIYAVLRPEISERVSVGLIIVDGEDVFLFLDQSAWHPLILNYATKITPFREKTSGKARKNKDSADLLTKSNISM